jgi:chorismate dehydratase
MAYLSLLSLRAMEGKIRVGAVSYLNTKPLLYGLERHEVRQRIELVEDYPANIAQMLLSDKIDIGLVPVAVIPKLEQHFIATDFCIGCDGPVASVCIFSEQPLEKLKTIYLDYQSRTSVMLATYLLKNYWHSDAAIVYSKGEDYREKIAGDTGGLVIGDRALEQRLRSAFIYDLGEAWKAHTGLPFVFATWVSNKKLPDDFLKAFNEANALGVNNIPAVLKELNYPAFSLEEYYTNFIDYRLDEEKRKGLTTFLQRISALK